MKRKLLVLLLVVFLFLTACQSDQPSSIDKNYKMGFMELEISIDDQMSPKVIHQNTQNGFTLSMNLFNRGGYAAENVNIKIANFDHTFLDIPTYEQFLGTIEANSIFNDDQTGGREFITFSGDALDLRGAEQKDANYRIFVSYNSKVEFSPTICINPSAYRVEDIGCNLPTGQVSFSGQGAPLAITKMEQILTGGDSAKMEIRVVLENIGSGDINQITLGKTLLGNDPLTCEFKGVVKKAENVVAFKKGKKSAELVCTRYLSGFSSYETPIYIELGYDYEFSERGSVKIKG